MLTLACTSVVLSRGQVRGISLDAKKQKDVINGGRKREREKEEWENNVRLKRNTEHDEEEALRDPDMKKN